MPAAFDDAEFNRLRAALGQIADPQKRTAILEAVGRRMAAAAEAAIPPYPPPSRAPLPKIYTRNGKPSKWPTAAARAAFFADLAAGKIKIPYRRTNLLGNSLNAGISSLGPDGVVVSIGTSVRYAADVIGNAAQQTAYHRGHWWQLDDVISRASPGIFAEAQQELGRQLRRALGAI
jgi:hypothetical protein